MWHGYLRCSHGAIRSTNDWPIWIEWPCLPILKDVKFNLSCPTFSYVPSTIQTSLSCWDTTPYTCFDQKGHWPQSQLPVATCTLAKPNNLGKPRLENRPKRFQTLPCFFSTQSAQVAMALYQMTQLLSGIEPVLPCKIQNQSSKQQTHVWNQGLFRPDLCEFSARSVHEIFHELS